MDRIIKALALGAALVLGAGAAHAQTPPPGAGGPAIGAMDNPASKISGDTNDRDAMRARDEELDRMRANRGEKTKTIRSTPAKPEDVTVGAEVRDKKGLRVGSIESVSMGAAVLKADGGAVEVPLEAFGKDSQGLLIGMTKAEFDKAVADALKPAN